MVGDLCLPSPQNIFSVFLMKTGDTVTLTAFDAESLGLDTVTIYEIMDVLPTGYVVAPLILREDGRCVGDVACAMRVFKDAVTEVG